MARYVPALLLPAVCLVVIGLCAAPAGAKPNWGATCSACHTTNRSGMSVTGEDGFDDFGAGLLKTFTVTPGGSVSIPVSVTDGHNKHSVAMEDLNQAGLQNGSSLPYTVTSGGWTNQGDYYTTAVSNSTTTTHTFSMNIGAGATPDVFLLEAVMAGKNGGKWSDSESFYLQVLPANADPVADAGGPYVQGDWSGPAGWNNPLREIVLDASGSSDTDGDTLLYTWHITNTYDPAHPVTVLDSGADEFYILALAELNGLLPPTLPAAGANLFTVSVTVDDQHGGVVTSPATSLFVPEPASLALLAVAGCGLLLRRRR